MSTKPYGVKVCFDCDDGERPRAQLLWDPIRESYYHRACARPGAKLERVHADVDVHADDYGGSEARDLEARNFGSSP